MHLAKKVQDPCSFSFNSPCSPGCKLGLALGCRQTTPYELYEHVLKGRLVLLQSQDAAVVGGQRADHRADCRLLFEDEAELVRCAGFVGCGNHAYHACRRSESG